LIYRPISRRKKQKTASEEAGQGQTETPKSLSASFYKVYGNIFHLIRYKLDFILSLPRLSIILFFRILVKHLYD